MSTLKITRVDQDGGLAIVAAGDLDLESSPDLLASIKDALSMGRSIVVDLKGVDYVDSSGIAVLVHGYKLAHRQQVDYAIRDPSSQVMAVIELSQLQKFFTIKTTEAGS